MKAWIALTFHRLKMQWKLQDSQLFFSNFGRRRFSRGNWLIGSMEKIKFLPLFLWQNWHIASPTMEPLTNKSQTLQARFWLKCNWSVFTGRYSQTGCDEVQIRPIIGLHFLIIDLLVCRIYITKLIYCPICLWSK